MTAWKILMSIECNQRGWPRCSEPLSDFEILMEERHFKNRKYAITACEVPPNIRAHDGEFYLSFMSLDDQVIFDIAC